MLYSLLQTVRRYAISLHKPVVLKSTWVLHLNFLFSNIFSVSTYVPATAPELTCKETLCDSLNVGAQYRQSSFHPQWFIKTVSVFSKTDTDIHEGNHRCLSPCVLLIGTSETICFVVWTEQSARRCADPYFKSITKFKFFSFSIESRHPSIDVRDQLIEGMWSWIIVHRFLDSSDVVQLS